jgi:hypothetical protein
MSDVSPIVLMLCRDLMFVSKVTATARAMQLPVKIVRDSAQLPPEGIKLLVDLGQEGAIAAAAGWKAATGGKVIGFAPHVDAQTLAQAKTAGFDQVLTRGQFTSSLETILRG